MRASVTVMKVGVGGSICSITPARYSGVRRKATKSPSSPPTIAAAAMSERARQSRSA